MTPFHKALLYTMIGTGVAMSGASVALAADVEAPGGNMPPGYEYFIRPYVRYGGSIIDGVVLNGALAATQQFHDGANSFESTVDLRDGTIKAYASMYGPNAEFGQATGVMGDVVRYTGAEDVAVSIRFDYNLFYSAYQESLGEEMPPFGARYFAIDSYFAVYEADSSATWDNWTGFGDHADEALYVGRDYTIFSDDTTPFIEDSYYSGWLGDDLFLVSGKSYKIYAAYNLQIIPGEFYMGEITLNALHTGTIGIDAPGGSFTSLSGEFLGFAQTPDQPVVPGIPEPASWAMLILGFGLVGGVARRREREGKPA